MRELYAISPSTQIIKLSGSVSSEEDVENLQSDLDRLKNWTNVMSDAVICG